MHDPIGIPACFSSRDSPAGNDTATAMRSGQSIYMSIYQTKIAGQCRLIRVTWCKNLLLHGLTVSVEGPDEDCNYHCKVELKPWNFGRKHGSKQFVVDGGSVGVFWDLKAAKFHGEPEPQSNYYVAIVCEKEVVLLLGDMNKDAYRRTGCRPSLIYPILVSRREHVFGKKKFSTRVKLHEKGRLHEVTIGCKCHNNIGNSSTYVGGFDPELEIRIDGHLAVHVKNLHWKFRGNESIQVNRTRVEVFWDAHDWLFGSGPRHALFIFKPSSSSTPSSASPATPSSSTKLSVLTKNSTSEGHNASEGSAGFCLFFYAWRVE